MDRPMKNTVKKSLSPLQTAIWLCLAALLGSIILFPEIFIQRKISLALWDDYLVDYQSTFALTGFFYQGGIQLWDFFGQLPHVFFWLTHGMFRLPNLLTAITYVLLSPFADNSAQFFDRVFSIVYVGTLLSIRTTGIFLLLKRLTDDKWILTAGTVIFALLFCPPAFLLGTFYQSFYPLWMYFILSFFLTWRPRYLGMASLFMLLSFSQGIIHTCYMYLGINFFIISCGVYGLCTHYKKLSHWQKFFIKNSRNLWLGALALLSASIIILGPYVYMQLFWLKDVVFGADHSRLSSMWSVAHYFRDLKLDQTPPSDFFRRMLDFTFMPGRSFFLGYSMFFLSGVAVTMSPDRRKWIFVLAILLVWSINFPRDTFSIGLFGHWINALTNPLKVMVRSYQTAINSIFGYLLMPLAAMGWGVLKDLGGGVVFKPKRFGWLTVFLVIFAVNGCSYQPAIVKTYFTVAMIISLIGFTLLIFAKRHNLFGRISMALFVFLFVADMALSVWGMKQYLAANYSLRPHFLEALPAQAGTVGVDFHNPKIFPFVARTDILSTDDQPFLWTLPDMSLNFNRVMNRQLAFTPQDVHNPRHISFSGWQDDPWMRSYVSQNSQLFFFAKDAVQKGPGIFENIIRRQLTQDVMMVEGPESSVKNEIPPQVVPVHQGEDQWFSIPEDVKDHSPGWVYENGMAIWDFPIPGLIPDYFATNIFTHDRWVRFFIQSADQKYIELEPVQGQLLRPMTFDVQNIKEGKVFVALPGNTSFVGLKGVLFLKMKDASGITSVWLHHSDATGITFEAPADGWLGVQFPYDPKWRIELDGKSIHFYRANKSFIGFPITQGAHKILIQYWPDSWLRWGLPLSVILTSVLFILLIIYALWEASSIQGGCLITHE